MTALTALTRHEPRLNTISIIFLFRKAWSFLEFPKQRVHTERFLRQVLKAGVWSWYALWAGIFLGNSCMRVSLWDGHMHFDCAGSHPVTRGVKVRLFAVCSFFVAGLIFCRPRRSGWNTQVSSLRACRTAAPVRFERLWEIPFRVSGDLVYTGPWKRILLKWSRRSLQCTVLNKSLWHEGVLVKSQYSCRFGLFLSQLPVFHHTYHSYLYSLYISHSFALTGQGNAAVSLCLNVLHPRRLQVRIIRVLRVVRMLTFFRELRDLAKLSGSLSIFSISIYIYIHYIYIYMYNICIIYIYII